MKVSDKIKALEKEIKQLKGDLAFLESSDSEAKITDYDIKPEEEQLRRAWRLSLVAANSGHVTAMKLIDTLLDELEECIT